MATVGRLKYLAIAKQAVLEKSALGSVLRSWCELRETQEGEKVCASLGFQAT